MTILQTLRRWFRRWNNGHKESGDIDVAYLIIMTFPLHTTLHIYLASNWAGGTIQRMSVTNIKALNLCRYIFVREGSRTVWTQGGGGVECKYSMLASCVKIPHFTAVNPISPIPPLAGGRWLGKQRKVLTSAGHRCCCCCQYGHLLPTSRTKQTWATRDSGSYFAFLLCDIMSSCNVIESLMSLYSISFGS